MLRHVLDGSTWPGNKLVCFVSILQITSYLIVRGKYKGLYHKTSWVCNLRKVFTNIFAQIWNDLA
jgi:hypothetical protein